MKLNVPEADGVPERLPLGLSEIPGGGVCATMDHVTGEGPDASRVCEYNEPTTAAGSGEFVVIISADWGETWIVIENDFVAVRGGELLSVTVMLKSDVPGAVGVPLIVPLLASVSPPGNVP